ncbi:hypothetical protein WMY93_003224 [Mugilogobius chulae]|uniref:Uncharacterized protein n=1 Tax=Mugilogobius chulae TaxID=88201 RepID=A0AAW0PXN5_9GOBI
MCTLLFRRERRERGKEGGVERGEGGRREREREGREKEREREGESREKERRRGVCVRERKTEIHHTSPGGAEETDLRASAPRQLRRTHGAHTARSCTASVRLSAPRGHTTGGFFTPGSVALRHSALLDAFVRGGASRIASRSAPTGREKSWFAAARFVRGRGFFFESELVLSNPVFLLLLLLLLLSKRDTSPFPERSEGKCKVPGRT